MSEWRICEFCGRHTNAALMTSPPCEPMKKVILHGFNAHGEKITEEIEIPCDGTPAASVNVWRSSKDDETT